MILVFSCYCCNLWCHNKPKFLGDRYHSWSNFLFVDSYFLWPSTRVCFATFHYCKGLFLFWCWEYKSIKISKYFMISRESFLICCDKRLPFISLIHCVIGWIIRCFFTVSVFITSFPCVGSGKFSFYFELAIW